MKFHSTRGDSPPTSLGAALVAGLAPDGGLYVPESLPRFTASEFEADSSLAAVATRLLAPFHGDGALADELPTICAEAFDFEAPLQATAISGTHVLELFRGPTAAFKDFGARFLAACMHRLRMASEPPLTIIVATSGDTGAAVAAAFHRRRGVRVVILYPDGRGRGQGTTRRFGDNVQAARRRHFDDCRAPVKQALNDPALQAAFRQLANSISLGRLRHRWRITRRPR